MESKPINSIENDNKIFFFIYIENNYNIGYLFIFYVVIFCFHFIFLRKKNDVNSKMKLLNIFTQKIKETELKKYEEVCDELWCSSMCLLKLNKR